MVRNNHIKNIKCKSIKKSISGDWSCTDYEQKLSLVVFGLKLRFELKRKWRKKLDLFNLAKIKKNQKFKDEFETNSQVRNQLSV